MASLSAEAQKVRDDFYVTNGQVNATVLSGNTLYIGGGFTQVGVAGGGGVQLNATSGMPVRNFPKTNGAVYAVVSDGSGGWYIGGTFTAVGGVARSRIAHILEDNSVSPWNPNADFFVTSLAMSGTTVYAGGSFNNIGGQSRIGIAALDANTGLATAWSPHLVGGGGGFPPVLVLAVSGTTVYAGGFFTSIGGVGRQHIAALDADTGVPTAWNPQADSYVLALAVNGSTVYAGGRFATIGGQSRNGIAALDATTGLATAWNPDAGSGNTVAALIASEGTVYAEGDFGAIGGQTRVGLAALDSATGLATSWNPNPNQVGLGSAAKSGDLALSGATLYVGGFFTKVGGEDRDGIAAIDVMTGLVTPWHPQISGGVFALAVSGGRVFAGGDNIMLRPRARNGIASVDVTTGIVTPWNPTASTPAGANPPNIEALAVSGTEVYAGGTFTNIGGQARNDIAALDARTGVATSWNPNADGDVGALAVSGNTVYAGAGGLFGFSNIGGQPRHGVAALDALTGLATNWNPNADAGGPGSVPTVSAIAVSGTTVYVGGAFANIGGQARSGVAALDAGTGLASAWNPSQNVPIDVFALAVAGTTVYAGGQFLSIGGQARNGIAALDAVTGLATAWDPSPSFPPCPACAPICNSLAISGSTVYVGGSFGRIGGQLRNGIAALDAATGLATAWNPNPFSGDLGNLAYVYALAASGREVYAGGLFHSLGDQPQNYLAAIEAPNTAPDCTHASAFPSQLLAQNHRLVPIHIDGVTDADGDPVAIAVTKVTQDEPLDGGKDDDGHDAAISAAANGSAPAVDDHGRPTMGHDDAKDRCPDAVIDRVGGVAVRAERSSHGNGRVYMISFTASDGRGGSCEGSVQVCVPRAEGGRHGEEHFSCIDDGQNYNSLGPCAEHRDAAAEVTLTTGVRTGSVPTLEYSLPVASEVSIAVYDIAGRRVVALDQGSQTAGTHSVSWDSKGLARGMYFCRLQAGAVTVTKSVLVIK